MRVTKNRVGCVIARRNDVAIHISIEQITMF